MGSQWAGYWPATGKMKILVVGLPGNAKGNNYIFSFFLADYKPPFDVLVNRALTHI